jgi:RNA polymerase sigma-70 factor (ECF subfamily)
MQTSTMDEGTRGEFDRLYREHGDRLWRSLLLYTGRPEVASDATAEAFAQAIRRSKELRDPLAWIWRAAFKIAAGEMHSDRRLVALDPAAAYEMPDTVTDLLAALSSLTNHQRASLVLHYYDGYRYREIATMLGSSASAVGVHIHRAKQRLREALEERDG